MPITALDPAPDHAAIARAHGAHAERVEDPDALPDAIRRALDATRGGTQALLDVVVGV
jgi:acetolactate synthase-1/2/3 large subunit